MTTYKIVRFFAADDVEPIVLRTRLTLDEAREHCGQDWTRGEGWFDGYVVEESS